MSDQWDNKPSEEVGGTAPENAPEANTQNQPAGPAVPPAGQNPVTPPVQQPGNPVPPVNGWSSDGSYRYVPPRQPQQPGTPSGGPRYTSPANNGGNWNQSPYNNVPNSPIPPQPPKKKGNGWVIAVSILAAAALIICVVLAVFAVTHYVVDENQKPVNPDSMEQLDPSSRPVDESAPSLEIIPWDDDDGGLSAKEIVNRNNDSTVVLTAYMENKNFQFGESNLAQVGSASGIVYTKDGYIITNNHCVINEKTGRPYDRIDVTTHDGKVYKDAKIVGADSSTDLAVIRVDADNLKPAKFGDSSELSVGDRVVALGNAAGLSWSATQGIVSALARDVYDDTGYGIRCLQVDAAINPGNSGGPLLNNQGYVVGINSSKIVAQGYEGLGFSIPINEAKPVIDSLVKYGYVKGRVALGITGKSVSSGMYNGFMIISIADKCNLAKTDAQPGDLIVGVDDTVIRDYGELRSALAKHKVGDRVTLKMLRAQTNGSVNSFEVPVVLQEESR